MHLSVPIKIPRSFGIWRQFIQYINNLCTALTLRRSLCDSSVLSECMLLLSEVMLLGQPTSMTIKIANIAFMR
jgi:hypothetical protein